MLAILSHVPEQLTYESLYSSFAFACLHTLHKEFSLLSNRIAAVTAIL